jgi:hypothetical protein
MAYPSVNFSSSSAGQVIVSFTGKYSATNGDFGGSGASDIRVKCQILDNSSAVVAHGVLSRLNGGCMLVADYPGGGVTWSAVTSFIDRTINGAGSVQADLSVKVRLAKR